MMNKQEDEELPALPFPWANPAGEEAPTGFLEQHGVHNQGAWQRECGCACDVAYGDLAPLLRQLLGAEEAGSGTAGGTARISREELAERLDGMGWWVVPGGAELLTTSCQAGGATQWSTVGPSDWASYCQQRPLDSSSLLPMLLDAPLTLLWSAQRLQAQRGLGRSAPQRLVIHLLGAEREVDTWPVLLELGALLPRCSIDLHLIGPEVPAWADGHTLAVASPALNSSPDHCSSPAPALDGAECSQLSPSPNQSASHASHASEAAGSGSTSAGSSGTTTGGTSGSGSGALGEMRLHFHRGLYQDLYGGAEAGRGVAGTCKALAAVALMWQKAAVPRRLLVAAAAPLAFGAGLGGLPTWLLL